MMSTNTLSEPQSDSASYWFKNCSGFAELVKFSIGQSGEAIRWRICYQRCLPRLVFCKTRQESVQYFHTLATSNTPFAGVGGGGTAGQ